MLSRDSTRDLAARAIDQLITVSGTAAPDVRDQIIDLRTQAADIVKQYLDHVVTAERVQISKALRDLGHADLIPQVAKRLRQQE
jgi:hypothetical protein